MSMMTASPGFEFLLFKKYIYSFGCTGLLAVACGRALTWDQTQALGLHLPDPPVESEDEDEEGATNDEQPQLCSVTQNTQSW